MPVQVDGEPWIQTPGEVVVLKSALKVRNTILINHIFIYLLIIYSFFINHIFIYL